MNSEFPNDEIFPPPSQSSSPESTGSETSVREAPRMPPQVAVPVVAALPARKTNRFALLILLLCAVLIAILCAVSRDFRVVFGAASAIWLVLHLIIRVFKL